MGRDPENPKRLVLGWKKIRVKQTGGKVHGMSKSQRKRNAKKAWKTRKKDVTGLKKSKKKAKKTRKANIKMGFTKK